jgi:hypothetical protein
MRAPHCAVPSLITLIKFSIKSPCSPKKKKDFTCDKYLIFYFATKEVAKWAVIP